MDWLDPLVLSRWQFGLTTVYHYLFVPLTIGMATVTAIFQTVWVRTGGKIEYLHLTRFFAKIFLINFAMGVVTGIVQEFQFGMNWSDYSRFVGDVFGAPLAFEGLLAFFLEATFIGLWIFGWDKLPKKVHLATIWGGTAIGTILSAYFIIAANAFMQNPVGYTYNAATNRAELTDFWALLTNKVALAAFPHTIFGALMFATGVVISVSAWHISRGQHVDTLRPALKFGLWGHARRDGRRRPLRRPAGARDGEHAADEDGRRRGDVQLQLRGGGRLLLTVLHRHARRHREIWSLRVPYLLAFLSTHELNGCVEGINDLNAQYAHQFASTGLTEFTPPCCGSPTGRSAG